MAHTAEDLSEERMRDLGEDTGAVTGFHVGVDRSTVCHVADGGDGLIEGLIVPFPVQKGDRSHSAVVAFVVPAME